MSQATKEFILQCESLYEKQMQTLLQTVCSTPSLRLLMVAGPSCSGKTTTTTKLLSGLHERGLTAHMLSIDDFFLEEDAMPRRADGKPDYEAFESFDLVRLRTCIRELLDGKETHIPRFDFSDGYRSDAHTTLTLPADGLLIIEGLHALNPAIYKDIVKREAVYGIFLECTSDAPYPLPCIPRFLRRLVRDNKFRRADAVLTFYLWDNVLEGEKKYIYPFVEKADTRINTFFAYEAGVLCKDAIRILSELPQAHPARPTAMSLLRALEDISPIDPALVPPDSLICEFIGHP